MIDYFCETVVVLKYHLKYTIRGFIPLYFFIMLPLLAFLFSYGNFS